MYVALESVGFHYPGGPRLFGNVTLTLCQGLLYGLVGPSGSGKSTMLSIIAGVTAPSEGTVGRSGVNSTLWVLQNAFGVARRTAIDHVALPILAQGETPNRADRRALDLLERFGLGACAYRPYETLSGGETQRLMLARALAAAPDLYLIDEPTAELDRLTAQEVNGVLREIVRGGAIAVVATHDHGTRDVCDEVLDLGVLCQEERE